MLKRAAKEYKKHVKDLSPAILRQLEARQLALKYVANVTYGKVCEYRLLNSLSAQ
jgi:DNA polymerase elongation subunit (family B)